MSRVSWSLQRRLAEIFEAEVGPFSTLELAARFCRVEAGETTDAQLSSVRRALNALVRKGVLITRRGYHDRVAGRREFSDQDHLTAMRVAASDMRATVFRSRTLIEQTRAMLREIS